MASIKAIVTENQKRIDRAIAISTENQQRINATRDELDWVRRVAEVNQRRIGTTIAQTSAISRDGKTISLRQEVADAKTVSMANADSLEDIEKALAAADVDTAVPAGVPDGTEDPEG